MINGPLDKMWILASLYAFLFKISRRTLFLQRKLLKVTPDSDIYVFWCVNSNFMLIKNEKTIISTWVKLRTIRFPSSLCGIKIWQPQFRRFGLAVAHYQHFEQHKAGTEHCSIRKHAKTVEVRSLIEVDFCFSCGQEIQISLSQCKINMLLP